MIKQVLVVGTSNIVEQLFKIALMDSPIDISTSQTKNDAEKNINDKKPDIIFVDPSFKDANAYEFVKALKEKSPHPVVLLKGKLEDWNEQEFIRSKADCVLKKPFEPNDLFSVIKQFNGSSDLSIKTSKANLLPKKDSTHAIKNKPVTTNRITTKNNSSKPVSAISLLKKAELENAKKFISTNLIKKAKSPITKTSKSSIKEALQNEGIELTDDRLEETVNIIAKEVVERVVWEVVPKLAETLIREELKRLTED